MSKIIETERIYLRQFILEDASALYKLNQNEEVLKYTGDQPFKNIQKALQFIKNYDQYEKYNMGRWAVCTPKKGAFIGWCGLKYHPDKDIVEVGYRFFEKYWNQGYATEASKGAILYGFNTLRLPEIYAYVDKRNIASKRVAEKCGMTLIDEIIHEGNPTYVFHIENQSIQVKEITTADAIPLRHQVLRQGKPIETCSFEGDDLPTTFHVGLYYYGSLAGIVTYMKRSSEHFNDNEQYQLRGMAIAQPFQGKKLGNTLIEYGERLVKKKKGTLIWCNAREIAKNFYTRNQFTIIGTAFDIPEIGPHYLMYKQL